MGLMAIANVWRALYHGKKGMILLSTPSMETLIGLQLFTAWVVVFLFWLWFTLFVANFYPLVDGGLKKVWFAIKGQQSPEAEETSGIPTPSLDEPTEGTVTVQIKLPEIS